MSSSDNLGNIIEQAEAARFVGRAPEIERFRLHINRTPPSSIFFYITGQGGVGKTTLLNRFKAIAKNEFGMLVAGCDEQQRDIPTVLGRFAQQLSQQDAQLKHFNERYKVYRQKVHEIEGDPAAPQGLAALLGKTLAHGAFTVGDAVPVLRKGLEMLPQDTLEAQAGEWTGYLAKKLSNKDEIALVRDPAAILTPLFISDLNAITQKQKALLCFENFEAAQPELHQWLARLGEYSVSPNIRFAIAGREQPGTQWNALRNVMLLIPLDVLSEPEAEQFLNTYGVTDQQRRSEILVSSHRLPVIMSWLAAPGGNQVDTSTPAHSIVDHFLRWVDNPMLREVALVGALPRAFNADILSLLLDQRYRNVNEAQAFDWLLTMPFVTERADGWYYHEVVRRMMIYFQRQRSPRSYREKQAALASYYNTNRLDEAGTEQDMPWKNRQWRKDTLSYLYHRLLSNPGKYWMEVISVFAIAVRKWRAFALELLETLSLDEVKSELSEEQNRDVQHYLQQLKAMETGSLQDGFILFDRLCRMPDLEPRARGHMLAYRAECYRLQGTWEDALRDFNEALSLVPDDARTFSRRGTTYLVLNRFDEALADLNQAIALNEKDAWSYAIRGETYRRMGQYSEALSDLNHAIELDEKHAWALAMRGETYRGLKNYEAAISDFNHAIAQDDKYSWAIQRREETQRMLDSSEMPSLQKPEPPPAPGAALASAVPDQSSTQYQPEPPIPAVTSQLPWQPNTQPDVPYYGTPVVPPPFVPSAPSPFAQPEPPVPLITGPYTYRPPDIPTWKEPGQNIPYFPSAIPPMQGATDTTKPPVPEQPGMGGYYYPPIPEIPETPPLAQRRSSSTSLLLILLVVVLIALIVLGFVFHIIKP